MLIGEKQICNPCKFNFSELFIFHHFVLPGKENWP